MESAFVLVVRRGAAAGVAAPPGAWSSDPGPLELGFAPVVAHRWVDPGGRIDLRVWAGADAAAATAFTAGPDGVAVVAGEPAWVDGPWHWDAPAMARFAALPGDPPADLEAHLRGVYCAVRVTADGRGWALADPLGLRCLYTASTPTHVVVASRAALAARAVGGAGLDPASAGWLAFASYHVGARTGYAGVGVVPPGAALRIDPTPRWGERPAGALGPDVVAGSRPEDLAEVVLDDVARSLAAVLRAPAPRHVVQLTGGKDSRLILAAALHGGTAREFEYETVGAPDLADVRAAAALCERFGLRHRPALVGLASREPFAHRFRRFVASTAGLVNGWDLDAPVPDAALRVTGVVGEVARTFRRLPPGRRAPEQVAAVLGRDRFGRLDLVRPEVAEAYHAEVRRRWDVEPHRDAHPLDRLHAHFRGHRLRFTRMGPRKELRPDGRVEPLSSPVVVGAAAALDPEDRQSEVLLALAMHRVDPWLVHHPFTDAGWDDRAVARLEGREPPAPPAGGGSATVPPSGRGRARAGSATAGTGVGGPAAPGKAVSLMQAVYRAGGERVELLDEVFADAASPAWEVLDRDAALAGLARYDELTNACRRELFGAASAVVWCAEAPRPWAAGHGERPGGAARAD